MYRELALYFHDRRKKSLPSFKIWSGTLNLAEARFGTMNRSDRLWYFRVAFSAAMCQNEYFSLNLS